MKKRLSTLCVIMSMGMAFICAYAQTPPPAPAPAATVIGNTVANGSTQFGDPTTAGGTNVGQGLWSFSITDPITASASAGVNAKGSGVVTPGDNSLAVTSLFNNAGTISLTGNGPVEVDASTFALQSNWATKTSPSAMNNVQNFGTAGSLTTANVDGTFVNPANPTSPITGQLASDAKGQSAVTLVQSPTSVQITAATDGSTLANMTFVGTNTAPSPITGAAHGNGLVGIQGIAQDSSGNMFAGGSVNGLAIFTIPPTLTSNVGGSLKLTGGVNASYSPTSVQSSASVTATSSTITH